MSKGRFGIYGGQYIAETLMNELINLEEKYEFYKKDKEFNEELNKLLNEYAGRPSLLYYAEKMSKDLGVSSKTGYQLLRENKIEHLKVGRAYRVPKAHLLSYLRLGVQSFVNF